MTQKRLLQAVLPLVADLARPMPQAERYRRLLDAVRTLLPADAVALLKLDGERLVPLAVDGLARDTLGRRFKVHEHPRFKALLDAPGSLRFAADCPLPDPYDGLVEGVSGRLQVHDCMGCAVRVDGRTWGLFTLDAMERGSFSAADLAALQAFASVAAATVSVVARMDDLEDRAHEERRRADAYRLAAGQAAGRALIGRSPAHRRLLGEIAIAGPSDLTVLVSGETGVGKELVAQALHAASPRAKKPMVTVNCAALPDTLVESELFGHVRGAFSGAVAARRGKFELADGGTLFLDEIGELPLLAQAKLLRVLQGGQLQRLGSDREHRVDVRLVAATNRDLAEEVRRGRFRADLFHRLNAYPLRVPPLRERGRDVLLLAGSFLEENRSRLGLGNLRLDASAQAALQAHAWPGNVRELEHLLGRAAVRLMGRADARSRVITLSAADLELGNAAQDAVVTGPVDGPASLAPAAPEPANGDGAPPLPLREAVARFERNAISAALLRNGGNWAAAARELGVDRANLSRMARRLGVANAPASAAEKV